MTPLNYVPPSEIDGSPIEVERACLDQLSVLAEEAFVQVRNTHMSRILDAKPGTSPEELAREWEESDRRAAVERITILLDRL